MDPLTQEFVAAAERSKAGAVALQEEPAPWIRNALPADLDLNISGWELAEIEGLAMSARPWEAIAAGGLEEMTLADEAFYRKARELVLRLAASYPHRVGE
jgi:hypothetical protein